MSVRSPYISLIFLLCIVNGFAQGNYELIGSPDVIVLDLEIDEDKNYLVASTRSEIQLWNYKSKTLIRSWASPLIHSIALYNGSLAGISKRGELFVWDIESGRELKYIISSSPLLSLAWIDSTRIVIGDEDGMLYKVNSMTGEIENKAKLTAPVTALSRYTNNSLLVGKGKRGIEVYDASALKPVKSIGSGKGSISIIQVGDSAQYFMTVSDENKVTKWRVSNLFESVDKHSGTWITSLDFIDSRKYSIITLGKLNGEIIINIGVSNYSANANGIVNKVILFRKELPSLKVVVATHGAGIQMWDADLMKFKAE